jgi:hypothetical protein
MFDEATASRYRRGRLAIVGALAVASALILAGCGGGESGEDFEKAEDSIHEIQRTLDDAVEKYKGGDTDEALQLAERAGLDLYEGQAEGVVADVAPSVNRQLDPLIEATIPGKIREEAPPEEVEEHVDRAQKLLSEALVEIEEAEHSE